MCSFCPGPGAKMRSRQSDGAILRHAEEIAGELGLFSEAVDARSGTFLGNTPLVFSQVEYARAAIALDAVRQGTTSEAAAAAHERA